VTRKKGEAAHAQMNELVPGKKKVSRLLELACNHKLKEERRGVLWRNRRSAGGPSRPHTGAGVNKNERGGEPRCGANVVAHTEKETCREKGKTKKDEGLRTTPKARVQDRLFAGEKD